MNIRNPVYSCDHNPFGRVPVDQTCEETVNKNTQTSGGTKGFSLKAGAVSKYYIVAEYRSIFLNQLKDMLDLSKSNSEHTDLQKMRIARDEADVKSLITMLESNWINPFSSEQQDLLCLSTGKVATNKIEEDLLNAKSVGEKAYQEIRVQRLEVNLPKLTFHDSLKKSKQQTFSELNKKVQVKSKTANEIILKADKALFGQVVIIAEKQTAAYERCPLATNGTSSLGAILSRWVIAEDQQGSTGKETNSPAICMCHRWYGTCAKVER